MISWKKEREKKGRKWEREKENKASGGEKYAKSNNIIIEIDRDINESEHREYKYFIWEKRENVEKRIVKLKPKHLFFSVIFLFSNSYFFDLLQRKVRIGGAVEPYAFARKGKLR